MIEWWEWIIGFVIAGGFCWLIMASTPGGDD